MQNVSIGFFVTLLKNMLKLIHSSGKVKYFYLSYSQQESGELTSVSLVINLQFKAVGPDDMAISQ